MGMRPIASTLASFEPPAPEVRRAAAEACRRAEAAQRERERAARLDASGIPPRYLGASMRECDEGVREWVAGIEAGGSGWLLLVGANGRGKTHQACAALRRLAATRRVLFATAKRAVDEAGRDPAAAARLCRVPALVLDDLGKEDAAAWKAPHVFEVLDWRYSHLLPTIVTTNLGSAAMLAHYAASGGDAGAVGASVVSRLSSARVVEVAGRDRRLAARGGSRDEGRPGCR